MTKVSVIIPSFNSYATVNKTLDAVYAQTRPDYLSEVIVVDSSEDARVQTLFWPYVRRGMKQISAGVRVIPAAARNLGARMAEGDLLAFIDSDAYPTADWLERIVAAFEDGCRAGGGSILLPEFQKLRSVPAAQFYLQFNEFMETGPRRQKDFVPSCNLFCERHLFYEAGGFPMLRASEDVLFGLEVSRRVPFWFVPDAKVFHIFRESLKDYWDNQKLLGRYALVYRRRGLPRRFYYHGLWPLVLLPLFVLVKLGRISGRIFSSSPRRFLNYLRVFPVFTLGLWAWSLGFVQGVFSHEN